MEKWKEKYFNENFKERISELKNKSKEDLILNILELEEEIKDIYLDAAGPSR